MLKKITGVLLSAALIVSAVGALTALPTTAARGSFTPQHMEVDFSNYVLKNQSEDNSANNIYVNSNSTNGHIWSIKDDTDNGKYLACNKNSKKLNATAYYFYSFILNPNGIAGNSKTDTSFTKEGNIFSLENGARYRITFDYKLANWWRNDIIQVKAGATGVGSLGSGEGTLSYALTDNDTAAGPLELTATDTWKTVTFECTVNSKGWTNTAMVDSLVMSFIPVYKDTGKTSGDCSFDLLLDNFVVDRVAAADIVNDDGTNETVYGAPACTEEYRAGFGTCEAEKIALPASKETYGGYADGIYTASADVPAFYSDEARENAVADPVFKAETQTLYYGNAYSTDTVKNQVAFCGFDEYNLRKDFNISDEVSTSIGGNGSFVKSGYRNEKWTISSSEAFTGTKSLYVNTTETDYTTDQKLRYLYVGNGYELVPGKTYNISFWVKKDTSKSQTADLNIGFANAGNFYSPNWLKGAKIVNADFTGDWQQVVIENVKIPETQPKDNYALPYEYYMAPVLQIVSNNAFWLDTVVISEIITPGDINKDAKVNICDLVALNNAITDNETDVSYMDLNNDAAVDDKDLAELRSILLSK